MKKTLAFLLLSSLFLGSIGYHFIFQIQQHKLKEEMEVYLRKNTDIKNAIRFCFSLSDKSSFSKLKWEGKNEFVLNGEMYDVIKKEKEDGYLIIYCINDKKESHLVNEYTKVNKETQGDPSSKNKSSILLKLMAGIYIKSDLPVIPTPFFIGVKENCFIDGSVSSAIKEILLPPPQAV